MEERQLPVGQRIPPLGRFEKSTERRALEERFREMEQGDFISYKELSQIAHVPDIRTKRYLLGAARRTVLREGIVIDTVTKKGVKRVDPEGALGITETHIDRMRNSGKRAAKVLTQIRREGLGPEGQIKHARMEVQVGITLNFASNRSSKKIEKQLASRTAKQIADSIRGALEQQFTTD